jgi:hypothetical protein
VLNPKSKFYEYGRFRTGPTIQPVDISSSVEKASGCLLISKLWVLLHQSDVRIEGMPDISPSNIHSICVLLTKILDFKKAQPTLAEEITEVQSTLEQVILNYSQRYLNVGEALSYVYEVLDVLKRPNELTDYSHFLSSIRYILMAYGIKDPSELQGLVGKILGLLEDPNQYLEFKSSLVQTLFDVVEFGQNSELSDVILETLYNASSEIPMSVMQARDCDAEQKIIEHVTAVLVVPDASNQEVSAAITNLKLYCLRTKEIEESAADSLLSTMAPYFEFQKLAVISTLVPCIKFFFKHASEERKAEFLTLLYAFYGSTTPYSETKSEVLLLLLSQGFLKTITNRAQAKVLLSKIVDLALTNYWANIPSSQLGLCLGKLTQEQCEDLIQILNEKVTISTTPVEHGVFFDSSQVESSLNPRSPKSLIILINKLLTHPNIPPGAEYKVYKPFTYALFAHNYKEEWQLTGDGLTLFGQFSHKLNYSYILDYILELKDPKINQIILIRIFEFFKFILKNKDKLNELNKYPEFESKVPEYLSALVKNISHASTKEQIKLFVSESFPNYFYVPIPKKQSLNRSKEEA